MQNPPLSLGEPADEAQWRALVEKGLKGADWSRLVGATTDSIPLQPLYRESDIATSADISGAPGSAPHVRGRASGGWMIRQAFAHPDPEQTNREILADLAGGVGGIELVVDPQGERGVAIKSAADFDRALADVILEAAPISLDAGEHGAWAAELLRAKLKGVAAHGTAFNLDPIGAFMRSGVLCAEERDLAPAFTVRHARELPAATFLRADARPIHEAGGTEAQEIAAALSSAIAYFRSLTDSGLSAEEAASALAFALSVGPDVLIETAKLRALRLCWARILEASGVSPEARGARIHAFTSQRMLTRYDAWTNILRITTAAFGAGVGGADAITTSPLTDALGLPTPFARRVARNTQMVLLEECRLGHVADPAGGAWFVEKLTRDLAEKAWAIMQNIEGKGGIVAALQSGWLQAQVATARAARQKQIATRRETITGVTDFPLLDATAPEHLKGARVFRPAFSDASGNAGLKTLSPLAPIRWAEPFEALRDRAEARTPRPTVFFATMSTLAEFAPRAQFARNLFAVGGVASIGAEDEYETMDALINAFAASQANVAIITSTDACNAEHAANCAQRLKAAGAHWVLLAGKPGENEAAWRAAGVDQFVFAGANVLNELETLHAALGIAE